jgi:hypothetical protein
MKKDVAFIFITLLFLLAFPLVLADTNNTQINNGFSCLNAKIGSNCPSLAIGEKIFSSLATGQCTSQLESSESSDGCFPSGSCDIKTTSQALLALKNSGRPIDKPTTWLLSQKIPTSNIDWYLQIDPSAASTCTISYSGNSPYTITVNDDKTLSGSAGSCLSVSPNGYWLLVSPTSSCYGINFSISCDQPFKTTTLYQRQGYPTIYVSSSLNSASSGGTLKNSVDSSCFGGTSCDYESSLWAALALDSAGKDISSFIPYLTVFADDAQNQQYIPYSFLYSLTSSSDFLNKLLAMQKTVNGQNYWDQKSINGQYYDTALALLPLQSTTSPQKTSAVNWLLSVQGSDGCWNSGNILDTAFILYSIAGSKATSQVSTTGCTASGYYCMSSSSCTQAGGSTLSSYTCPAAYSCCNKQLVTPTCSAQSGVICSSGQICQGGSTTTASDTTSAQTCCIGGSCAAQPTASACELASKSCRNSCLSGEQIAVESCTLGNEVCCEPASQGNGTVWIILLIILIVLVLLGIIFRKKLRVLWMRIKSKFKKGSGSPAQAPPRSPPPFRPQPSMGFQRRPLMIPPHKVPPQQRPTEVNDVLKRLKEIGK